MKYCLCFGVTVSLFYVRMGKPFNPILGETFEGLIDGCPVYGEQICHHPPISSSYMKGRGYTTYGTFEPIFHLGINKGHGNNDGLHNIEFEDKLSKIKFNTPDATVSGMMFGERGLHFSNSSYFMD